jgi:hypothetical protein
MSVGKREQINVTSCQCFSHIITYQFGRLSYLLVSCYTQSSQNQSMQWFTEILRHVGRAVTFGRLWVKFLSSGLWPRTKHVVEFPEQHHKYLFTLQRVVGSVTNTTLPRLGNVYSATGSCEKTTLKEVRLFGWWSEPQASNPWCVPNLLSKTFKRMDKVNSMSTWCCIQFLN